MDWQFLLVQVIAVGGLVFSIWRYSATRSAELRWRRTEFLFKQGDKLDNDSSMQELLLVLSGKHPKTDVTDLVPGAGLNSPENQELQYTLERLLSFLDRLYYAVHSAESISLAEAAVFGWHVEAVCSDPLLKKHCEENGYHDVVALGDELGIKL